jgi:hypothetical protein
LSGRDCILTPEHSILRHRRGGEEEKKRKREEEKKRKKRKGSRVVTCGALFGMGFVDFYYYYYYFPEFVYGQQGCRLWCSIWDGICQIFFILFFFF